MSLMQSWSKDSQRSASAKSAKKKYQFSHLQSMSILNSQQYQHVFDKSKLSVFNAIESVKNRKNLFQNQPDAIPKQLDPDIEKYFSETQKKVRQDMFKRLNETKSKKGDKVNFNSLIMLKGTQKNNHGNLHQDYRGSIGMSH